MPIVDPSSLKGTMSERTKPSSDPSIDAALSGLKRPLWWTRLGMVAERFVQSFWPVWTIAMVAISAFAFGIGAVLGVEALWVLILAITGGLVWSIVSGLGQFRMPTPEETLDRLDRTMPGRPIAALIDTQAIGAGDAASQSVWQAHLRAMAARVANAHAPEPNLRISGRDPYALRIVAVTAFVMAVLFGGIWRVSDLGDVIAGAPVGAITGPSWEGWVEPPLYTGKPSLYLNDLTGPFEAPAGSAITLRLYGEVGSLSVSQTIDADTEMPAQAANATAYEFLLTRSGEVVIAGEGGRTWQIEMLADQPPVVSLEGDLSSVAPGQMQMEFNASDDNAVIGGQARIALDAAAADRRHGLAIPPEPRDAIVLDLPTPFSGSRAEFSEIVVEDLSEHPFANLPVTLTLTVDDHAGQTGVSVVSAPRLPALRFFNPLANSLIEQRRDLLWSRDNADRAAMILRAVTHRPEAIFDDDGAYLMVRTAIRRLESGVDSISAETRDQVAALLWNAAIVIEEGDLSDALEQLRRAQDRLSEAMRQGASDDEIAQLMDELREAMDDYMQQLAENAEPGEDQPDQSGETMEMTQNDLDEMLRRIEELMQQGRMAEAQQMLDALREMMENMQITQGEGGDGPRSPGQQAMDDLQDTLRGQQGLSDESFRELQEQFSPGQRSDEPNDDGQQGQGQAQGQGGENDERSLAEQQEDLRRQLEEQADDLPGQNTEGGQAARRSLDDAERAMDRAAEALERGDIADALDSQSEAMEAMRDGMSELGRALAEADGQDQPGQGQADGTMPPDRPLEDPLGRQAGNAGSLGSDENFEQREEAFRRARDLLDEIRRRSADQDRPNIELEYLRRLLDQF